MAGHKAQYKTFDSSKEAKKWVRDIERELEGKTLASPNVMVSELVTWHLNRIVEERPLTAKGNKRVLRPLANAFKGTKLSDLEGNGLYDWIIKHKKGKSPATVRWVCMTVMGIFNKAEMNLGIKVPWSCLNQAHKRLVYEGKSAPSEWRDRRLRAGELERVKLALGPVRRRYMPDIMDFAVASAMRVDEICNIKWEDLDREKRTVIIRNRKHPRKKAGNDQVVPLLCGSFEIIERQVQREGEPRIFPVAARRVSEAFSEAVARAGVKDLVFHDLRHEGISRLFELGFQIQEVALVSGHTDWKTLRRYTHLRPASLVQREEELKRAASL